LEIRQWQHQVLQVSAAQCQGAVALQQVAKQQARAAVAAEEESQPARSQVAQAEALVKAYQLQPTQQQPQQRLSLVWVLQAFQVLTQPALQESWRPQVVIVAA
jgi:hypothetical protein